MKAVLLEGFGGPDRLRFAEVPDPVPGPGEILLRVRACALNHLDLWVRGGIPSYKIRLPHILGSDVAGTVVGGDLAASEFALHSGMRVAAAPGRGCRACESCLAGEENRCAGYGILGADGGPGGYAELVCVPAQNVFPIPDALSDEEAAAIPLTFLTAWHMLITQARVRPGQTVLVLGAGSGVGVAAIQIAALAGARVIAASRSEKTLEAAKSLGARDVLRLESAPLHRKIMALTGGAGVDVVFEHIGPAVFDQALKSLKPGGILVTCGSTTGPTVQLDMRYVFFRELRVHGAKMGTLAEFRRLWRTVSEGRLKGKVDSVFPLTEAGRAHEYLEAGKHFGKVVLKIP